MEFKEKQTISTQISEYICENIMNGKWKTDEKIPSVREYAAEIEVNINTIIKSYNQLEDIGIVIKKRGIGYFVTQKAKYILENEKKKDFFNNHLPNFKKAAKMLKISWNELKPYLEDLKE